jgi:nicotinamidase-related amidase
MNPNEWIDKSKDFLVEIDRWVSNAKPIDIDSFSNPPERSAIISVDVINGFCYHGPLASERVAGIIQPIVRLLELAWECGIHNIILTQDAHEPEAIEFAHFPPHCVRGSDEAETVPEIKSLPFFEQIITFSKNSIHSGLNTGLNEWTDHHPEVDQFIVVGDCTDLCTYQLAMHLRLDANAHQLRRRVVVPLDCVSTYDLPVSEARQIGSLPHDAELLHRVFLYSMGLNGIEIAAQISS